MLKILRPVVLLATVGLFGVAGMKAAELLLLPSQARETTAPGERAVRVSVVRPEAREMEDSVSAVGTIEAHRSIDLRPLSDGRVVDVSARSGARIERHAPLLRLDARAQRAALSEAEATLAETRAQYDRFEQLSQENVASRAQIEDARAAFERARAQVEMAQVALDDRSLTAPFDGTVGILDIDPGEYVDTATVIAAFDDLSVVEAEFTLPERYFDRVREGQSVRITTAVHPGAAFEGEVSVKSPRISAASRSFAVRAQLENSDGRLTSGMFMRATLVFGSYDALAIPDDAVISEGDTSYVFTVEDGTAQRTELSVTTDAAGRALIRDGLSPDARVVVAGWDNLSDGAPVEIADGEVDRRALQ